MANSRNVFDGDGCNQIVRWLQVLSYEGTLPEQKLVFVFCGLFFYCFNCSKKLSTFPSLLIFRGFMIRTPSSSRGTCISNLTCILPSLIRKFKRWEKRITSSLMTVPFFKLQKSVSEAEKGRTHRFKPGTERWSSIGFQFSRFAREYLMYDLNLSATLSKTTEDSLLWTNEKMMSEV